MDAWVSLKRLEKLIEIPIENAKNRTLTAHDTTDNAVTARPTRKVSVSSMPPVVEMQSASFAWTRDEDGFQLKDLNLRVNPGRIVGWCLDRYVR